MKIRNKQTGQIIEVTEDQLADYGLDTMAKGGMIKRADGSYSRRGLWDNIRANKGSGKKPTKEMLKQEKKIRAAEKAYGGYMQQGGITDWWMANGGYLPMAQEGMEQSVPMVQPSMLQPVDQTQLPLRQGVAEQVPFTIRGEYSAKEVKDVPKKAAPKYVGLVDYLASTKQKFDYKSREKLAKDFGITNYTGTADQNKELLKRVKARDKSYKWSESASANNYNIIGNAENPRMAPSWTNLPTFNAPMQFTPPSLSDYIAQTDNTRTSGFMPYMNRTIAPNIDPQALNPALAGYTPKYPNFIQGRATGGCMSCGGKMQAGGKTFADIERERANILKQMNTPVGASEIIDYPPIYITTPTPKQKAKPKVVYPPYQPKQYIPLPASPIIDYPPTYTQSPYAEGGKMPQWLAEVRFKAAGKEDELGDYGYLDEAGDGKWIQKAINPKHKGYCTPMTKSTCTPRRKALAKTLKKMAKNRKADGGYAVGGQYEMDDAQIAKLRAMGYKIKEV